ncbi:hypothetical protein ACFW95_30305 [Streptomyces sp. NPDC059474]|uniref:hypothetical protein n=1 Tax=unclassified Streptomyces TaxID=2593676 RepID=UPI0033C2E4E9
MRSRDHPTADGDAETDARTDGDKGERGEPRAGAEPLLRDRVPVLAFSSVAVDSLDTMAAVSVGTTIRDGYGCPDTYHAPYRALSRPEFTGMSILLTDDEDAYPPGVVTVDIDSPGMLGFPAGPCVRRLRYPVRSLNQ